MPAVSLVCPHCETHVQIQVTAVARSRPCPHCGTTLLLQVAEKTSGAKRKALLVAPTPPTDVAADRGPNVEPKTLPGDVFGRMSVDPSVQRLRRRLIVGGAIVAGLITVLTGIQLSGVVKTAKAPVARATAEPSKTKPAQPGAAHSMPEVLPIIAARTAEPLVPIAGSQFMALANLGEPREVLQKFLEAPSVEERLQWVAAHEDIEPLMRHYYRRLGDGPVAFTRIHALANADQGTHHFDVQITDGSTRTATLVNTPKGYRVDWPSFVAYGELAWDQLTATKPVKPTLMRVLAAPSDHYAGPFADSDVVLCLQLFSGTDPSAGPVYGYALRGGTLAREIEYWLQQAEKLPMPMTLRVKYPADAVSADQFWITELVAASWVVPAGPAISRAP